MTANVFLCADWLRILSLTSASHVMSAGHLQPPTHTIKHFPVRLPRRLIMSTVDRESFWKASLIFNAELLVCLHVCVCV